MKQCMFSDAWIDDFRWQHFGDYVCFECRSRLAEHALAKKCEHALNEESNHAALAVRHTVKEKTDCTGVQVDTKRIENDKGGNSPSTPLHERFLKWLETEGIITPERRIHFKVSLIKYPYITSVFSK